MNYQSECICNSETHKLIMKISKAGEFHCGLRVMNPTSIHENTGLIPGSGIAIWLWHRPTAAALIRPLAWEPLYAENAALKRQKKKKKKGKENIKS